MVTTSDKRKSSAEVAVYGFAENGDFALAVMASAHQADRTLICGQRST